MDPQGTRIEWTEVPAEVRDRVAAELGSPVVEAVNQPGGFSPGVAARVGLADGRRAFVKAVSAGQNPESPAIHRREAQVAAALPVGLPVPRFQATIDEDGWVVLVFDEVDGRPPDQPWTFADLSATVQALVELAELTTPCPLPDLETFAERHRASFGGFGRLAGGDRPARGDGLDLDPWTVRHLDDLAELESGWEAAVGDVLVHSDVRADNLLVEPDGRVVLVDWPHAAVAASWVDLVLFLPSVGLEGGPSPIEVEARLDPLAGVDPAAVDRVLAALLGYFTEHGARPDPPGLPTLRAFQRAQGDVARTWLAHRRGWT